MNLKFRWNKAKARENYRKHGVTFDLAKAVFHDAFAIELLDDRRDYGEERFVIIGMVEGRILYVAYSERDDVIRMISARRATKHEEQAYYEQASWGTSKDDTRRH
jgi:uncharacterized protein